MSICVHMFIFTAAKAWTDTTTTDQSETASEAPSTPLSDPVQLRTPGGGKKHHFIPKTVCLEAGYKLVFTLLCAEWMNMVLLALRWSSLSSVWPVGGEQSLERCVFAARIVGRWPIQSAVTAALCPAIPWLLPLPWRQQRCWSVFSLLSTP